MQTDVLKRTPRKVEGWEEVSKELSRKRIKSTIAASIISSTLASEEVEKCFRKKEDWLPSDVCPVCDGTHQFSARTTALICCEQPSFSKVGESRVLEVYAEMDKKNEAHSSESSMIQRNEVLQQPVFYPNASLTSFAPFGGNPYARGQQQITDHLHMNQKRSTNMLSIPDELIFASPKETAVNSGRHCSSELPNGCLNLSNNNEPESMPKRADIQTDDDEQPLDLSSKKIDIQLFSQHVKAGLSTRALTAGSNRPYTQENLNAAVNDIRNGRLGTRRASVVYGIPRSTLRNKIYKLEAFDDMNREQCPSKKRHSGGKRSLVDKTIKKRINRSKELLDDSKLLAKAAESSTLLSTEGESINSSLPQSKEYSCNFSNQSMAIGSYGNFNGIPVGNSLEDRRDIHNRWKPVRAKRGHYRKYDKDALDEAVKSVKRGEMSVHRAGSFYGVPHSTLEYKVKERNVMRSRKRSLLADGSVYEYNGSENGQNTRHSGSTTPIESFSPASSGIITGVRHHTATI